MNQNKSMCSYYYVIFIINHCFLESSIRKEAIKLILEENPIAAVDLTTNPPVQFLQYSMEYLKFPIMYSFKVKILINFIILIYLFRNQ